MRIIHYEVRSDAYVLRDMRSEYLAGRGKRIHNLATARDLDPVCRTVVSLRKAT